MGGKRVNDGRGLETTLGPLLPGQGGGSLAIVIISTY